MVRSAEEGRRDLAVAWGWGFLVSEEGFQGRLPSRGFQKQDLGWGGSR